MFTPLSVCLSVTVALAVVNPGFGDQTLVITSLRQVNLSRHHSRAFAASFFESLAMRLELVLFVCYSPGGSQMR